jgi:hypothetical protein
MPESAPPPSLAPWPDPPLPSPVPMLAPLHAAIATAVKKRLIEATTCFRDGIPVRYPSRTRRANFPATREAGSLGP